MNRMGNLPRCERSEQERFLRFMQRNLSRSHQARSVRRANAAWPRTFGRTSEQIGGAKGELTAVLLFAGLCVPKEHFAPKDRRADVLREERIPA